jgi:endoglucanase
MLVHVPYLLLALILAVVFVACQTVPVRLAPTPAAPRTPGTPNTFATPAAANGVQPTPRSSATELPSGQVVTLGPVNAQVVLVDQVGYLPDLRKVGVVADASATTFEVIDVKTSRSVFAAQLDAARRDSDTGQSVRRADFSAVTQPGTYTLQVAGVGRSADFRIGDDVYQQLSADSVSSYAQLAALAPQAWQTAPAAERLTGQTLDVTGGWPDAGDYGRYMPSAATALGTMLLLDDVFPQSAGAQLAVFKCELDWMLKMQRADGAVYHKVTPLQFGGFAKGSDNMGGPLFVFDASTPDAAVFAAVMAEGARVYRGSDPAYAQRLLQAAQASWAWLQRSEKPVLPAELEGTGGYVYGSDATQRFWAAAELHKTTGDAEYASYVNAYLDKHPPAIQLPVWTNTTSYGLLSLLFSERADPALRARIGQELTRWADGMVTTIDTPVNPWALSLSSFRWASNKTALDNAVLLLLAHRQAPNQRYVESAADQLHYVLGRNALGKSYVTGYGANSVKNPHNRTMFAIGRLVPGVLVGGPNADGQDDLTPRSKGQLSYVDELQAYASNENSVEYNAPLVFVTALLR